MNKQRPQRRNSHTLPFPGAVNSKESQLPSKPISYLIICHQLHKHFWSIWEVWWTSLSLEITWQTRPTSSVVMEDIFYQDYTDNRLITFFKGWVAVSYVLKIKGKSGREWGLVSWTAYSRKPSLRICCRSGGKRYSVTYPRAWGL